MFISVILVTKMCDSGAILLGEIRCWSFKIGQGIKGEVRSRNDMTSVSAIIRTYEIYNLPQIEMLKLALLFNFFSNELKKY